MKTIKLAFAILVAIFVTSKASAQCSPPCDRWRVENRTGCAVDLLWDTGTPPCAAAVHAGTLPANTPPTQWQGACIQVGDCGYYCPTALTVWDLPNPNIRIYAGTGTMTYLNVKACASCPSGFMKAVYTPSPTVPHHNVRFECQ